MRLPKTYSFSLFSKGPCKLSPLLAALVLVSYTSSQAVFSSTQVSMEAAKVMTNVVQYQTKQGLVVNLLLKNNTPTLENDDGTISV